MESQIAHGHGDHQHDQGHGHGHAYEQDPNTIGLHSVVEGEDEQQAHHEKKSVLKKVKAKAKKLKDTITKHGHGHDHEHDDRHGPEDHDLDEEDDEDDEGEEMVEDPEVHGAPTIMSANPVRSAATEAGDREQLFDPRKANVPVSGGKAEKMEQLKEDYGSIGSMEEGVRVPAYTPQPQSARTTQTHSTGEPARIFNEGQHGAPKINLGRPEGLEEDPDAPSSGSRFPSNYETKVTDPTHSGGNEAKIAPLDRSFGEMKIRDEAEVKPGPGESHERSSYPPTGSHDQFSPEPSSKEAEAILGAPEEDKPSSPSSYTEKISFATAAVADKAIAAKNLMASKLGIGTKDTPEKVQVHTTKGEKRQQQVGSYTGKISWATHVIAYKAASAKDAVASKLGYGAKDETGTQSMDVDTSGCGSGTEGPTAGKPKSATEYVTKILSPVHEKVTGAGGAVMSKVSGGGGEDKARGQDRGVSVKEYLVEKLKPGEEDKALSEVISGALHKGKKETSQPTLVTESEEVRRQLGGDSGKGEGQLSSPGKGVVEMLRGTVGSWLGKTGGSQASPHQQTHGEEEHEGERKHQESSQ